VRLGCSDGDPCTDESCDDTSGLCVAAPNTGADCDDGNRCTAGDRCLAGLCTAGPGIAACLPLGPCWASTCDASAGCLDMPLPPGTPCGTDRECTASGICECRAGTADCDRDGTCECDGRCEATSGACVAPCVNDVDCGTGQSCCPSRGTCYPTTCLGCCMVAVGLDAG
jgi:hypothetical protein